jgi:hypothetical protein
MDENGMTGDAGFIAFLGITIAFTLTKADLILYRDMTDTTQCFAR